MTYSNTIILTGCYEKNGFGGFKKVDGFYMNGVKGDGAVYTSVKDYYKYDLTLRNKSMLSSEVHDLIFKPSSTCLTNNGIKKQYGMGWYITGNSALHSGRWIGTSTFVIRKLNEPLTIAVFANCGHVSSKELAKKTLRLVRKYLENTIFN